jgi:hypothetical protein
MKRLTKKRWFGPKKWGWGWRPVTWQGWLVVLVYVALIALLARDVKNLDQTTFFIILALATIILIIVAYLTGGKPGSESF